MPAPLSSNVFQSGLFLCRLFPTSGMAMSAADAVTYAVGEAVTYIVGRILGRTFRLEPKRAQGIGEVVVITMIGGMLIALTVAYS